MMTPESALIASSRRVSMNAQAEILRQYALLPRPDLASLPDADGTTVPRPTRPIPALGPPRSRPSAPSTSRDTPSA